MAASEAAETPRPISISGDKQLNLQELKNKKPEELLEIGEDLGIENASVLRKQDLMFAILKEMADQDVPIFGQGTLEVLPDGFGFLRAPEANYLAGPDDIYVSPSQVRRFALQLLLPPRLPDPLQLIAELFRDRDRDGDRDRDRDRAREAESQREKEKERERQRQR